MSKLQHTVLSIAVKIKDSLFKGAISDRIFCWTIFLSVIVNFCIEPIVDKFGNAYHDSSYGVPEPYRGKWEINDYESDDVVYHLQIEANSLTYRSRDLTDSQSEAYVRNCSNPKIQFEFTTINQSEFRNTWPGLIVELLVNLVIPKHVFGNLVIFWKCDQNEDPLNFLVTALAQESDYLSSYNLIGLELRFPIDLGPESNQWPYTTQHFERKLRN